jgi:hypothetical protein
MVMKKLVQDSEINLKRSKGKPEKCVKKYALPTKTPPDCILKSIYVNSSCTFRRRFWEGGGFYLIAIGENKQGGYRNKRRHSKRYYRMHKQLFMLER